METTTLPALTSRNINIPRLAVDAAHEIDQMMAGRLKESVSAKKLANILVNSFSNGKKATQMTVKSGTVAVFCNALENLRGPGSKTDDFREVISAALEYAKQLDVKQASDDKRKLEETKNFCIALARAAAGFRESVIGAQAQNRWR
jgi:hypothetical protein